MMRPTVTTFDLRCVDSILESSGGYVLDFTNASFAQFFDEFGIDIDDDRYGVDGDSKGKRLRCFLRLAEPAVAGRVLNELLKHRFASRPENIDPQALLAYQSLLQRLIGDGPDRTPVHDATAEAALLARQFDPKVFDRLPLHEEVRKVLIDRMEEAETCQQSKAFLAAVILSGSVLEGMCLGFGQRFPKRVNQGFIAHFNRPPGKLNDWKLVEWLDVLGDLRDLSPNVTKFGQCLREFRNYVHPAEQVRHGFCPDQHTAVIGFHVVVAAADDLAKATSRLKGGAK